MLTCQNGQELRDIPKRKHGPRKRDGGSTKQSDASCVNVASQTSMVFKQEHKLQVKENAAKDEIIG